MNPDFIRASIREIASRFNVPRELLSPAAIEIVDAPQATKAASYDSIRLTMRSAVWGAVFGYLSGDRYVVSYNSEMAAAIARGYLETLEAAYQNGGGSLPVDDETNAWARGVLDAQLGYVDELFAGLRDLRRSGEFDATDTANARADSYANALDGFYTEAKMRGSKNIMLTWRLGGTEKHCKDCAKLDGQRHKISWYIDRDYIPRKPAAAMECGGWNCDCSLVTDDGEEYTV